MARIMLAALVALAPLLGFTAATRAGGQHWQPAQQVTWQVQFTGRLDLSVSADIFDIDAFDSSRRSVRMLHVRGRRAVCYVNAGAWEDWRPDAGTFPWQVMGRELDGWPGERWLDVRRLDVLAPILAERIELCRSKGFDGIEFDNVDGYSNDTGFSLSRADQLAFNRWLAGAAHDHGLAVGLKNALDLARELEPAFDFAVLEQCFFYRECGLAGPFVSAGKPVLDIEYAIRPRAFCARANMFGISAMRKRLALDAWRRAC